MLQEDILPHKVTEAEFIAVIRSWRVKNNFIPTGKDVLEQLTLLRSEVDATQQKALAAAPEPVSKEYCKTALDNIASILDRVNATSPAKHMPRQHGSRV
ncbi:hypothetical protein [Halodesulfovibrio spirochaetisodalis]|uniref:Uncharacterized protein n=1 Tax=Halodesulfovibrio spirochaetisodalis TaxID=1560234 RepID=A0A1B7XA56_9BACT|nr:hypothetical protein [Halodesulfovibrio spirochaetisodalis]OBQ46228.1 hypothetical protein SP90_13600 [Halodesulfovibrio spirochaetisodalis]